MGLFRKSGPGVEYIVAFLGNPGPKYAYSRHNVGFMVCDAAAKNAGARVDRLRFRALTGVCEYGGKKVLFMKPQTYMNLSGDAVSQAMRFYKTPTDHLITVSDDVSLPVGKIRIRRSGSAGGHNGLKDIIAKCGGDGFPRIKVGVGAPPHPDYDMADWVLGAFRNRDAELMEEAYRTAADALETMLSRGIDEAMARYN
ncbi:MAG: aminoacyl-tRNA hydrolase [Oscillospiraceae bacterium]|nr:aminoacyl-tRNA hydrolase [Oscillospiraceae bacterium]